MPPIEVTTRDGNPQDTQADTRICGLYDGGSLTDPHLQRLVDSGEAKGTLKRVCVTHQDGGRVIIAGLGKEEDFSPEKARLAAAAAATRAKELGAESLSWAAPEHEGAVTGIVQGTLLSLYEFDAYKSKQGDDDQDDSSGITSLEIVGGDAGEASAARVVASAQNAARDLQNEPSNVCTPEFLSTRAREIASNHDSVEFESFGRDQIAEMGMGAFSAVAQGSDTEPELIVLRYDGGSGPHLGFVGKAVTFDTGGISIKPAGKMHEMKFDMSGGAAVIEAIGAIAELAVPVKITAVVPATENMPSGHSMKPGDIVTAKNGVTIEVNNTDAEGRLILADALCYANEQGVERVVNFATLTGAIIAALGHTYAGFFSNDDDWCDAVVEAGRASGEEGWRLPLHPEFADSIKGKYGDISNIGEPGAAGSIGAAEFLKRFVDDTPWVHVDIAGTAWGMKRNYIGSGASGFGVRLMVEVAQRAV